MAWLNSSWRFRKKIEIPSGKVNSDLTDFPVLVNLGNLPIDFWHNTKRQGADIRITTSNGTTEVPVEIVYFDKKTKDGSLHFKATGTLAAASDNEYYIYYGNSAASLPAASATYGSQNVWDSNYKLVAHIINDPSGTAPQIKDSTSNGNDGTSNGSMTTADLVDGKIEKALDFDGSNDYIDFGNDSSLQITSALTVETWINGSAGNQQGMLGKQAASNSNTSWLVNSNANGGTGTLDISVSSGSARGSGNAKIARGGSQLLDDTWHHLGFTFSSNTLTTYADGVDDTSSYSFVWNGTVNSLYNSTEPVKLGGNVEGSTSNYKAFKVDEFRISNVVRSADWIKAGYDNQNAPEDFYNIESTETEETAAEWYGSVFDSAWSHREILSVDPSKVIEDCDDYPLYVDLSDLSAAFWSAVKNGGADIRVTTASGAELAREVVACDTATDTGEMHVRIPILSASHGATIHIYAGNASATEPAATATYGRNNVWSKYTAVYHLEDVDSVVDSTGNHSNASKQQSPTNVAGKLGGQGVSFAGADQAIWNFGIASSDFAYGTLSAWLKSTSAANNGYAISANNGSTERLYFYINSSWYARLDAAGATSVSGSVSNDNTWHYASMVYGDPNNDPISQSRVRFDNGSPTNINDASGTLNPLANELALGLNSPNTLDQLEFTGQIDEFRLTKEELSDGWAETEYNNQHSPSTFYDTASDASMHEWSRRLKVEIDSTKVQGQEENIPLYLDLSTLPASFFTNIKSAGEDIRITLADGYTELPFELVNISTGGETGQLHYKYPRVQDAGTEAIYVYYDNSNASAHGNTDVYGRNNVWTEYEAVFHLDENPGGSAPQVIDSTGNGNDGTSNGSMTSGDEVAGKIDNGLDFEGINDYISVPSFGMVADGKATVEAWIEPDKVNADQYVVDESNTSSYGGGLTMRVKSDGGVRFWYQDAGSAINTSGAISADTLYHVVGVHDGTKNYLYLDGAENASNTVGGLGSRNAGNPRIGHSNQLGGFYDGVIDEVRISSLAKSADWVKTIYNNQSNQGTFYTVGSEENLQVAPTVNTLSPADNATDVGIAVNLVATFDQNMAKGTGNITIKRTSDDVVLETIDVTSGLVTISNAEVTINPSVNFANSTEYYVLIDATALDGTGGLDFAGISSTTEWSFTTEAPDLTAPTLSSSTPADGATAVSASANIVLDFDENVQKGTGDIVIHRYSDDVVLETIDVTSGLVTISNAEVTINPSSDLPDGERVYILIDNTAIEDLSGNAYAGISSKDTLDFTVADTEDPVLSSSSPEADATAVVPNADIVLTFDENVQKGTGNITIKKYSDDSTIEAIDVTSGQVTVSNTDVTINPSSDLDPNTKYYLEVAATAIDDLAGNSYAGISNKDTLSFTTIPISTESITPADSSVDNAVNSDLEIDFNQDVAVGTGNVTISQRPNLKIGGDDFAGDVGEIILAKGEGLDETTRQKMEGYLAWRWFGASNPLISSHPFKYRGPGI